MYRWTLRKFNLKRRDDDWVARMLLEMQLPGNSKRRRPNNGYLDVVKEDVQKVAAWEDEAFDRRV